jgi:hypothetical protein
LADLPPRAEETNSSPEIWRADTQRGPPGGPSTVLLWGLFFSYD